MAANQVYLASVDGSGWRRLTHPRIFDPEAPLDAHELRGNLEPDMSPDGRYVVVANVWGVTNESWILRIDVETGEVVNLSSFTCGFVGCADRQPRYSPDGSQIAFVSSSGAGSGLWIMDSGGQSVRRLDTEDQLYADPVWSPDGRWIAYVELAVETRGQAAPQARLMKINVQTGERVALVADQRSLISSPSWAPDGSALAFVSLTGERQPDLHLVSSNGGNVRPLAITSLTWELFIDWQ
jgi:Tol biopolymer transport system component